MNGSLVALALAHIPGENFEGRWNAERWLICLVTVVYEAPHELEDIFSHYNICIFKVEIKYIISK